ncbi:MAG: hypothetical protein ACSLFR_09695 [Solirubrobacteraceae bacterium]
MPVEGSPPSVQARIEGDRAAVRVQLAAALEAGLQRQGVDQATVDVAEVTLNSGYDPDPPFGTPLNPNCLVPESLTQCVYSNVAWLFSSELGFSTPPYAILESCGASNTGCKFRFSPRGIGNGGDVWQTLVAAHRVGTTTVKEKKGYAIYARPKFRWVNVNATGAVDFKAGVAYAVRGGTTPTYASCINGATINATSSTSFDCVKVTGSAGSGHNPSLTLVFTPAGGGAPTTKAVTVRVTQPGCDEVPPGTGPVGSRPLRRTPERAYADGSWGHMMSTGW